MAEKQVTEGQKLERAFSYSTGCIGLVGVVATVLTLLVALWKPSVVIQVLQQYAGFPTPTAVAIAQGAASPEPTHTPYPPNPTYTPYPPNPTYTPYPTDTPYVTPTATPTPVREVALPFADNFDAGLRPEWEPLWGEWRIANGRLTTTTRDAWSYAFVGDPTWRNYVIEVDFAAEGWFAFDSSPIAVVVRAQDINNLAQFQMEHGDSYWMIRERGDWLELIYGEGTSRRPISYRGRVKVEVREDFYAAHLDDELWLSITDDTFGDGQVGLGIYCERLDRNCTTLDNFVIRELPD